MTHHCHIITLPRHRLADLSGFTKMSGRLCDLGQEGLDALSSVVNVCFDRSSVRPLIVALTPFILVRTIKRELQLLT